MRYITHILVAAATLLLGVMYAEARDIPRLASYVNDTAGIINTSERRDLEDRLSSLKSRTTAQVFILTVKSLEGEALSTFAQRTFERWKPGTRKKDNGLLIVHSVTENGTRIHVGRGLEGDIPDAEAIRILRELMLPHLSKKAYGQAFSAAVTRVDQIISGEAKAPETVAERNVENKEIAKFLLFLVAFVALAFAHFFHPILGGFVGAGSFAGTAWVLALSNPAIIVAAIIGGILGLILRWLTDVPWCFGGCGDMASSVAGAGGDALGAGAELFGS